VTVTIDFGETHRERVPEWVSGTVELCWGILAFADSFMNVPRHTMDGDFFAPMISAFSQREWGLIITVVGLLRLTFLAINGNNPRSSTILRTFGAAVSGIFWLGFSMGALNVAWLSGAVFTYGGWFALDAIVVWYAAGEIMPAFAKASIYGTD